MRRLSTRVTAKSTMISATGYNIRSTLYFAKII